MSRIAITLWQYYEPDMKFWTYFCFQPEICPTTDREHWQAYGETLGKRRFETIKKHFAKHKSEPHLIQCRGSPSSNREYCSKTDTATGDFVEFGKIQPDPEPGKRNDIDNFAREVLNGSSDTQLAALHPGMLLKYQNHAKQLRLIVAQQYANKPRDIQCLWIYGAPGSGKSRKAFDYGYTLQGGFDQPLISNTSIWFEGYTASSLLIIDELRPDTIPTSMLNRILDRYPLPISIKGSSSFATWTKVIITSNYLPDAFGSQGLDRRVTIINTHDDSFESLNLFS